MSNLAVEILTNREKYPDTMEITLLDGSKTTVKDFRDNFNPRQEFTRASEAWAREKQQLSQAYQGQQAQLQEAQQQLQQLMAERAARAGQSPLPAGDSSDDEAVLADPVLGKWAKKVNAAHEKIESLEKALRENDARIQAGATELIRDRYNDQLSGLESRFNSRFNKDGKGKAFDRKAFLDYVIERGKVNPLFTDLGIAYNEFTRADELTVTAKEAEERGIERGKQQARVPNVPFGRRSAPAKAQGLPETFAEVTEDQMANDPDIQRAMSGVEEG